MSEKKEDLRIRRTKKLLSNATFELLKKKPFEKITVCDICEEAMVHRATFYSHFSDKYELLTYSIDEHLPMKPLEPKEIRKAVIGDSTPDNSYNIINSIISYISENRDIYASILKQDNTDSVPARLQKMFEQKLLDIVNELIDCGVNISVKPEFWAGFYAGACLNVVTKWLTGELKLSEDELIGNLNTLLTISLQK